ncbi:MAG: FimV/HubP family polar landmark protein [Steroidobacteraceae bacterium]
MAWMVKRDHKEPAIGARSAVLAITLSMTLAAASALAQQRVITTATPGPQVTTPAAPAVPTAPATPQSATELRRVRPGESLMAISRELAASRDVTLAQAMVGLYRGNPAAFVGGDMSQLLVGAELRLPARTELVALSRVAAFREVQQRLGIWGGAPTPAPESPAAPVAESAAPTASDPTDTASESPAETDDVTAQLAAQQAEIASLKQALDKARAELETQIPSQASAPSALQERLGNLWWLWGVALAVIALLSVLLRGQSRRAEEAEAQAQQADIALARLHRERDGGVSEAPALTATLDGMAAADQETAAAGAEVSDGVAGADGVDGNESEEATEVEDLAEPAISAQAESKLSFNEIMSANEEDLEGDPPPIEEAGSMIDLARAYIEMGDHNAAMTELQLALKNGNEAQRAEALRLLDSLPKS